MNKSMQAPARARAADADQVICLRNLCRSYREGDGRRPVLTGLDLDIRRGECVALVGRSGSGKSTLLNLISGIDQPTAGDVTIAGHNLTRMSERQRTLFRRQHIGFIYQAFNLIPTLTVEENLLLPLELNHRGLESAHVAVGELLQAVGLRERAAAFPEQLSGGEQQRVAIARALIHRPSLVLADEPTGNLDAETGRGILRLLQRLTQGGGNTLVLVTHSAEVAALADRILMLDGGRLTAASENRGW